MANRKISDLTALTAPATGDLLPIVDISEAAAADKNKKITFGELFASIPLGTAAAPSIAFEGDNTGIYSSGADTIATVVNGAEAHRTDSSGRLLVGVSTTSDNNALLQVSTSTAGSTGGSIVIRNGAANTAGNMAELVFKTSVGFTSGFNSAKIAAIQTTTAEAVDLAFYTYGAGLGTEAMRIKSTQIINFSNAPTHADNTAATAAGLAVGDVYKTVLGVLMIRF